MLSRVSGASSGDEAVEGFFGLIWFSTSNESIALKVLQVSDIKAAERFIFEKNPCALYLGEDSYGIFRINETQ
jgi:hypothetical protein